MKAKTQVRDIKNFQKEEFIRVPEKEDFMEFSETYTVDKIYGKMQVKLLNVIDKHVPIKVLTKKKLY